MWSFCKDKWCRFKDYILENILGVHDTPHRIALGVGIGMFVAFTPTISFQMVLSAALATLCGANKVVGLPIVWLTNPVTAVPIYYGEFVLGKWLLGRAYPSELFNGLLLRFLAAEACWATRWAAVSELFSVFAWPLLLGSLVVSTALGVLSYAGTIYAVAKYRRTKEFITNKLQLQAPLKKGETGNGSVGE